MLKPLFDIIAAAILLIILSPLILAVVLLLTKTNKGSVIFVQTRSGYNGRPFNIIKFRTMKDSFDDSGRPLPDELRITNIGKLIRSASIDELLQLINVLKGDMSLVGPRPLLMQYLERYTPEQSRRHAVKPGITGLSQGNGRIASCWGG